MRGQLIKKGHIVIRHETSTISYGHLSLIQNDGLIWQGFLMRFFYLFFDELLQHSLFILHHDHHDHHRLDLITRFIKNFMIKQDVQLLTVINIMIHNVRFHMDLNDCSQGSIVGLSVTDNPNHCICCIMNHCAVWCCHLVAI